MRIALNILSKWLIFLNLFIAIGANAMSSPENDIQTTLSTNVTDQNHLIANVDIENRSSDSVWIFTHSLCENGKSSRSLFSIHDSANHKIAYIGRYIKIAPKSEHFLELKSGDKISTTCQLDRLYDFHENEDTYTIQFSVSSTYLDKNQKLKLESNTVSVRYSKKQN